MNKADTLLWRDYFFKYDTLVAYPLPANFNISDPGNFEDIITAYANCSNQHMRAAQFHNLFSINKEYSGYIGKDSIYIMAYYRRIENEAKPDIIFNQEKWLTYVSASNYEKRQFDCQNIRTARVKKGYRESDVLEEYNEECWMLNNKNLK
jgi:hypothetical protein